MGFLKRLGRFIEGLLPEETEETLKYGQEGEEMLHKYAESHGWKVYPNRVVMDGERFREIDAVMVAGRFLFCVEIKNWRGTVKPKDKEHWLRFRSGSNKPDIFRNAHTQALQNTYALKGYLNWSDKKMRGLWVEPLVIFVKRDKLGRDGTNADAVRGFEKGIVYLDELEKFVAWKHRSTPGDRLDYKLIMPITERIYTWDTVEMEKENNLHWGIVYNKEFWLEVDGKRVSIPTDEIKNVLVKRKGIFSEHDEMAVHLISGKEIRGISRMDYLKLKDPKGNVEEISFRNIKGITIGGVRKLKFKN
ncbi:MAG: nuclease-related domain-containing protein [candidate division WOR-3 bacterium]